MGQRTVVVIDDDPVVCRLMEVVFELEGYAVRQAHDGPSGIELVREVQPDAVLVDVMMPGMDGLEVLAVLRSDPLTARLPIVLVSAKAQVADLDAGRAAGASDYVTKPFDPLELVERVERLWGLRR